MRPRQSACQRSRKGSTVSGSSSAAGDKRWRNGLKPRDSSSRNMVCGQTWKEKLPSAPLACISGALSVVSQMLLPLRLATHCVFFRKPASRQRSQWAQRAGALPTTGPSCQGLEREYQGLARSCLMTVLGRRAADRTDRGVCVKVPRRM